VAVVGDTDELASSGFDLDADTGSTGVERVFEEFFDDGGGAFDDFAGGDLVRHEVREDADAAHRPIVRGSRIAVYGAVTNLAFCWSEDGKVLHRR
jgi:hypothetical protein